MGKILISEEQLTNLSKNLLNEWSYLEKAYDNTVDYLSGNQGLIPGDQSGVKSYLKGDQGWIPDDMQKNSPYLRGEEGILPGDQTQLKKVLSSQWAKLMDNFSNDWTPINDKFLCVPNPELRAAIFTIINNREKIKKAAGIQTDNLFLVILKMAVATIGRETDYGQSSIGDDIGLGIRRLPGGDTALDFLRGAGEYISGKKLDQSLGPAQFTSDTWESYNLHNLVGEYDQVGKMINALKGAFYRIAEDYKLAISRGVGTKPSINPITKTRIDKARTEWNGNNPNKKPQRMFTILGTGNVSLDLAILAHNMGKEKIQKYCKTNNPNYNGPCNSPNGIYEPKKGLKVKVDKNAWVPGYFPNLGSGALTSIGYVEEVAKKAKSLGCIKL